MKPLDFTSADTLAASLLEADDETDFDLDQMGSFKDMESSIEATRTLIDDENVRIMSLMEPEIIARYAAVYETDPPVFAVVVFPKKQVASRAGHFQSWAFVVTHGDYYINAVKMGSTPAASNSANYYGLFEYPYSLEASSIVAEVLVKMRDEVTDENFGEVLMLTTDADDLNRMIESGELEAVDTELFDTFQDDMVVKLAAKNHIAAAKKLSDQPQNIEQGHYLFIVDDFNNITFIFGDQEASADEYFAGDAYDWFHSDYTPSISDITYYLDDDCYAKIWAELMGGSITLVDEETGDEEEIEVTPQLQAEKGNRWLEQLLDDESNSADGLEDVRDKLRQIASDTITRCNENEFNESLMDTIKDAFGPYVWNEQGKLVFRVPWTSLEEYRQKAREDHRYDDLNFVDFMNYGIEKKDLPDSNNASMSKETFKEVFMETF